MLNVHYVRIEGLNICEEFSMNREQIEGCLLGTAIGDYIGLPYENLSPRRASQLLGPASRHRLFFGYGMGSDDTEHSCLVLQALCESELDSDRFDKAFARRLKRWFLTFSPSLGRATLKACVKLVLGSPSNKSGVFSGGNGLSMRSSILATAVEEQNKRLALLHRSSRITHTDPQAEWGAIIVSELTRYFMREPEPQILDLQIELQKLIDPVEAKDYFQFIEKIRESLLQLVVRS